MDLHFEPCDMENSDFDPRELAELIYEADVEKNSFLFSDGDEPVDVIVSLIRRNADGYFLPENFKAIMDGDKLIGCFVGFKAGDRTKVDLRFGKELAKEIGIFHVLTKLSTLWKLKKLTSGEMRDDARYMLYLTIKSSERGKGYGTKTFNKIVEEYEDVYLHVSDTKERTINFYDKLGFERVATNEATIDGEDRVMYLMRKKV